MSLSLVYKPTSDALPLLTLAIQRSDAREDVPSINATENAISAVTKICRHVQSGVPMETMLPLWFSWLPVVVDKEEAPHVYSYLCDLIEKYISLHSPSHCSLTLSLYLSLPPSLPLSATMD